MVIYQILEYLLGGMLGERAQYEYSGGECHCLRRYIYKEEKDASCQSVQPHIGTPSGAVGVLTFLAD